MVAQALWHLELAGGAEVPMLVRNDFVITNASLTDEVADVNARSVVKVAFEPKNPAELNGDDEDDEDMSDDDDEDDLEGLTPEDLESDEEDDEAVKEFKQEMRAKISAAINGDKPKTKSNEVSASAIATEEDDDDEDEDEDEDEDDEDFSLSEEPVDIALCALTPGKIEQVQLNLVFNEEDVVVFKNTGKK
jgi:FK506-binding nuclear protein